MPEELRCQILTTKVSDSIRSFEVIQCLKMSYTISFLCFLVVANDCKLSCYGWSASVESWNNWFTFVFFRKWKRNEVYRLRCKTSCSSWKTNGSFSSLLWSLVLVMWVNGSENYVHFCKCREKKNPLEGMSSFSRNIYGERPNHLAAPLKQLFFCWQMIGTLC